MCLITLNSFIQVPDQIAFLFLFFWVPSRRVAQNLGPHSLKKKKKKKKLGPHPLGTSVLVGTKPSFYFLLFFSKKEKKKKSPVCTKQITTAQHINPVRANLLSHSVFKIKFPLRFSFPHKRFSL